MGGPHHRCADGHALQPTNRPALAARPGHGPLAHRVGRRARTRNRALPHRCVRRHRLVTQPPRFRLRTSRETGQSKTSPRPRFPSTSAHPLIDAYLHHFAKMPTVARTFETCPTPRNTRRFTSRPRSGHETAHHPSPGTPDSTARSPSSPAPAEVSAPRWPAPSPSGAAVALAAGHHRPQPARRRTPRERNRGIGSADRRHRPRRGCPHGRPRLAESDA